MSAKEILEFKISRASLYSLLMATGGLFVFALVILISQVIGLLGIEFPLLDGLISISLIVSAIILGVGIVYNGFVGLLKIVPAQKSGAAGSIANLIYNKKIYFVSIGIIAILIAMLNDKFSFLSDISLVIFTISVLALSFSLATGYIQLIQSNYLKKRQVAELISELNQKAANISVIEEIKKNKTYQEIVADEKSDKKTNSKKEAINFMLRDEVANENLSALPITILILNEINKDQNPPEALDQARFFWQNQFKGSLKQ